MNHRLISPMPDRRPEPDTTSAENFVQLLEAHAAAETALVAGALEHLAHHTRRRHPQAEYIEFTRDQDGTARAERIWAGGIWTPPVARHLLWTRPDDSSAWQEELDALLDYVQGCTERITSPEKANLATPPLAEPSLLIELPPPDIAAYLAHLIHRQHPHAAGLLLSLDTDLDRIDIAVEHLLAADGTSIWHNSREAALHPDPLQRWWQFHRDEIYDLIRHLWRAPHQRARYLYPQGDESLMWNQGIQLLLLPEPKILPTSDHT
ncbi:hypothetical protein LN042_18750 [Kitasatospora sp. RB6PN24]|uniref:hypothetical protein n=1 Tax=Kitasatospora humi TaxID=2893891 RepID=UPI001E40A0AA|nr:hypothetical protein [Kitasatospora humi]MCC9309096.1 hypothetical protein [Kitasatospora humi]